MGARGPQPGRTLLQQEVARLALLREYQHPDGRPSRGRIARAIGCTRQAVQRVLARLAPTTLRDAPLERG